MFEKKIQLKKKPHPLIDLRKNMPEKQVIFLFGLKKNTHSAEEDNNII